MQVIKYVSYLCLCGGGCISNILGMGPGFVSISPFNVMSFGTCDFVFFVFLVFSLGLIFIYYYFLFYYFC